MYTKVIGLTLLFSVIAAVAGWVTGIEASLPIASRHALPAVHGTVGGDLVYIFSRNVKVALLILAGASTAGATSVFELSWNSFGAGYYFCTIPLDCLPARYAFLAYAPLEIAALGLVTASAVSFPIETIRMLCSGTPLPWRLYIVVLIGALAGLALAASLESLARHQLPSMCLIRW